MPTNMGLSVGLASSGRPIPVQMLHAMICQAYPSNTSVFHQLILGKEVGEARERLVEEALKVNTEFLWFIDDDTSPPHYAISKLIYEMRQNPDIAVIGGIYCMKNVPPAPVIYRGNGHGEFWDWAVDDVFEVTGIGTGCMLIRTAIFKSIERPWFKTTLSVPDKQINGEWILGEGFTDDLYFCEKARAAGFRIFAHGGVLCDHWDIASRTAYFLPKDSLPYRNRETGKRTAPLETPLLVHI